ncbi:MAG: hypothetical protein KDM64_09635, partial [Verrucomicrobiae bacterium]|nr:hypothetical protein [Verrucomicrobiae bacterium]
SGGVSRFLQDRPLFSKLSVETDGIPGMSGRNVTSVFEDSSNRVWIGSGGGLDLWDPTSGGIENGMLRKLAGDGTTSREVTSLLEAANGQIWVGTREGEVIRVDTNATYAMFPPVEFSDPQEIARGMVTSMVQDRGGRVWVASRGGGITVLTPEQRIACHFLPEGPEGLTDRFVNKLCRDRSGTIWVGTAAEGLLRFDEDRQRFERHPVLNSGEITDLFLDSEESLWVGSAGRGLTRLNLKTGEVLSLSQRNSDLPDNNVRSLSEDGAGFLWVATDEGWGRLPVGGYGRGDCPDRSRFLRDSDFRRARRLAVQDFQCPHRVQDSHRGASLRRAEWAQRHRSGFPSRGDPCPDSHSDPVRIEWGARRAERGRHSGASHHDDRPDSAPVFPPESHRLPLSNPRLHHAEAELLPLPAGRLRRRLANGGRLPEGRLFRPPVGGLPLRGAVVHRRPALG